MWNLYWNEINGQPKSDIFIRSHVHYYSNYSDGQTRSFTTSALQGWGSGIRRENLFPGIINIGFLYFEIKSKTDWFKLFYSMLNLLCRR